MLNTKEEHWEREGFKTVNFNFIFVNLWLFYVTFLAKYWYTVPDTLTTVPDALKTVPDTLTPVPAAGILVHVTVFILLFNSSPWCISPYISGNLYRSACACPLIFCHCAAFIFITFHTCMCIFVRSKSGGI